MSDSGSDSEIVVELAEEFIDRYRRGDRPPLAEYTSKYPDLAERILDVFPAMAMMENIAIHEESGNDLDGGEDWLKRTKRRTRRRSAITASFARWVAAGWASSMRPSNSRWVDASRSRCCRSSRCSTRKHKRRFEREAKAAARLHHTNIVPVFGVGEHDGLHYYVMQFIQGLGLDEVIEELRHLKEPTPEPYATGLWSRSRWSPGDVSAIRVARSLMTGQISSSTVDRCQ